MGTDINGWVEFRDPWMDENMGEIRWHPVVDVCLLLSRDYKAFASLFGVRNYHDLSPIAARRGLPDDVSDAVREDAAWEGNHSHTWITWREIAALGPQEREALSEPDFPPGVGFPLVFEMMESLAKRYGDDCVRLVVWFDN